MSTGLAESRTQEPGVLSPVSADESDARTCALVGAQVRDEVDDGIALGSRDQLGEQRQKVAWPELACGTLYDPLFDDEHRVTVGHDDGAAVARPDRHKVANEGTAEHVSDGLPLRGSIDSDAQRRKARVGDALDLTEALDPMAIRGAPPELLDAVGPGCLTLARVDE